MSSQGKAREHLAATPDFASPLHVNPDEQGSDKSGQISPFDLNKLSTSPSLDQVNKRISDWLHGTKMPLGSSGPSFQNQENVPLSGDAGPRCQEQIREIEGLRKVALNNQLNLGTVAPANTPQSRDDPGLRGRAISAGRSGGNRPHMGSQAKIMEDSDLPRPLLSGPKPRTAQETSSSLPDDLNSSKTPDEANSNGSELPNKPKKRSSSAHARVDTSVWIREKIFTPQTTASTSQPSASSAAPAGLGVNRGSLVRRILDQRRGLPPTAAKYIMDNAAGSASAPAQVEPSLSHSHYLERPSPLSFQHAKVVPVPDPRIIHLGDRVAEAEPLSESTPASAFQHFQEGGCQHRPTCQGEANDVTLYVIANSLFQVMRQARPKSRSKRIRHDVKQLLRDCFCRNPVSRLCAGDFVDRAIQKPSRVATNESRPGSQNRNIFERTGNKTARNDKSNLSSFEDRLRRGAIFDANNEPRCDASPPPNERTLSYESSVTAHETSIASEPPANGRDKPKNIFQRLKASLKARWETASCERARLRREPPVFICD
jgi:hypothetical protein